MKLHYFSAFFLLFLHYFSAKSLLYVSGQKKMFGISLAYS